MVWPAELPHEWTDGTTHLSRSANVVALESQLAAANSHVTALETQLQQLQQQIDPKATEALAAVAELAKALKLLAA